MTKLTKLLPLLFLLIFPAESSNAQSTFKTAQELAKLKPGNPPGESYLQFKKTDVDQVIKILGSLEADTSITYTELRNKYITNPFFRLYYEANQSINSQSISSITEGNLLEGIKSDFSSIGSMNISTIADGAAQFLIARANQELTIAFFGRFQEQFKASVELQTLFPVTNDYVSTLEPVQYVSMMNALKEAFREDLGNATINFNRLIETDIYRAKIEAADNPNIYFGVAGVQIINELKQSESIPDIIEGLGENQNIEKASPTVTNVFKIVSLISQSVRDTSDRYYVSIKDFKQNILDDPVALKIYLGLLYEQARNIELHVAGEDDPVTLSQLIGQLSDSINLRKSDFVVALESAAKSYSEIAHLVQKLKNNSEGTIAYSDYAHVIDKTIYSLESSFALLKDLEAGEGKVITQEYDLEKVQAFLHFLRKLNRTIKSIDQENYASVALNIAILTQDFFELSFTQRRAELDMLVSVVNNLNDCKAGITSLKNELSNTEVYGSSLLNQIKALKDDDCSAAISALKQYYTKNYFDKISELIDTETLKKLRIYGAFIANVAEAESSEEVKTAIEAAVLPVGSYRVKRDAKFTISINSYVGAALYNQNFVRIDSLSGNNQEESDSGINSYGLNAPIGLELGRSFSKRPFCLPAIICKVGKVHTGLGVKSISLFLPLVDIGSIVNFRMNPEENENIDLPPLTLDNILATGGYVILGLEDLPISIGAGWQKGPQLRELGVADDNSYSVLAERDWGFGAFLSVDIPLFNLKVVPR